MKKLFLMVAFAIFSSFQQKAEACTGITLRTTTGSPVTERTIEWAGNDLESRYTIVPRGYSQRSFTPSGEKDGMTFTSLYGYVGLSVEKAEFVVEGINEAGLAAGLFYFPSYGEYESYSEDSRESSISVLQSTGASPSPQADKWC